MRGETRPVETQARDGVMRGDTRVHVRTLQENKTGTL